MSSQLLRTMVLLFLASMTPFAGSAYAKTYPTRPLRLIVPFPPGGGVDIIARVIAADLSSSLGKEVIVDNRAGGGTIIGTELLAQSAHDGYTMMMANVALGANPALHRKLPYNTLKDFAPVSLVVLLPGVLVVNPALPAKSIKELVALAKSEPGKLSFASAGTGSYIDMVMELFKSFAGVNIVHVPYKGAGPALTDVLADRVPIMFITPQEGLPYIRSGKLRALGVSGTQRMALLPDVPTIAESGYPGFESYDWQGVIVPAHTPAAIIAKLNKTLNRILSSQAVKDKIASMGATATGSTPAQLGARIRSEIAKWTKVVKEAHIPVSN